MRAIRSRLTYSNVLATASLFVILGGAAWAAAGSGGPPIHSCYSKRTGALRIATRCKRSERALTWNKLGAEGLNGRNGANGRNGGNGAAGAAGATGAVGGRGPSDVYAGGAASGQLELGTYQSFGQTIVPAGSYLLQGKATFLSEEAGAEMLCTLAGAPSDNPSWDAGAASAGNGLRNVVALSAVQTFAATQAVEILCKANVGKGKVDNARVTAIRTESLHGTTPLD